MPIKKVKVSQLPIAESLANLFALGIETVSGINESVKVPMALLKGNTAFEEWKEKNPGKTYEDWIAMLREPATEAAEELREFQEQAERQEQFRENAEKQRIEDENIRQINEQNRQENTATAIENTEKVTKNAESATTDANNATAAANKAKDDAIQATKDTKDATEDAKEATKKANDAANRSVTLSDNRDYIGDDGFWYRYNEETKQYENTGLTSKGNLMYATFVVRNGRVIMRIPVEYNGPMFIMRNGQIIVRI